MPGDPGAAWPIAISPGFALSLMVSLLAGLVFHALFGSGGPESRGGGGQGFVRGLGLSLLAGLLGFTLGEAFARQSGAAFGMLGSVHLLHGLVGAIATLVIVGLVGRWIGSRPSATEVSGGESKPEAAQIHKREH